MFTDAERNMSDEAIEITDALTLASDADFAAALTLGSDFPHPLKRNGKPCHYFWKEALPLGRYVDAKGQAFEVTPQRVGGIIDSFNLAKSRGFEPCAPSSHKVTDGKNYGYIVDARRNAKGSLEVLHQFIGDDARDEALTKKTSVCVLRNATDEFGNTYPELLDHNAVLPNPRLSNLSDFVPAIAASRGEAVAMVELQLAAPQPQEIPMDLSMLRKKLGAAADVPDEQLPALAEQRITTLETAATAFNADKTALSNDLNAARLELSRALPGKPTARELRDAGKNVTRARDDAIRSGALTPAIADKVAKRFMPTPVDPESLTLSRTVADDDHLTLSRLDTLADVFESLIGNKPGPATGEQSGLQLSRHVPGSEDEPATDAENQGREQGEAWKNAQLAARGMK